jgi:hypothetical protein
MAAPISHMTRSVPVTLSLHPFNIRDPFLEVLCGQFSLTKDEPVMYFWAGSSWASFT